MMRSISAPTLTIGTPRSRSVISISTPLESIDVHSLSDKRA